MKRHLKTRMNRRNMAATMVFAIALAAAVIATSPAHGKKGQGEAGLKKVVAIGNVDMGNMGFDSVGPGGVGDMFRQKAKAELEKTGRYVVVLPKYDEGSAKEKEPETVKVPTSAAEAQRYMAEMMEMQKKWQKDAARSRGKYAHEPVSAQGLFNFTASKGGSGFDTGGIFSTAESFGAPSGIGQADFSTSSIKVEVNCLMLDPQSGQVLDQKAAKASTTKLTRVSGVSYYTMEDSSNPERAFDRMFTRALKSCVSWIDKKMSGEPWEAQVFKAKGRELYVNAGRNAGLAEGMTLDAFARGEVSGGGISVGMQDEKTGTVEISKAFDAYSIATPVSGSASKGSVLKQASN
ncbi:MAG: hypothetical protein JXA24_03010 [Proteobacteria bacterium]|nr:hypothetical protein [Pseudomonadota bacterium]